MKAIEKLLEYFRLNTEDFNQYKYQKIPKYIFDTTWIQYYDESILDSNGFYDFKNFSKHESDTINHVLSIVKEKYPEEYQSIGLANESYQIKYKPRYILFELIIQKYQHSYNAVDKFSVALSYAEKGSFYRKLALKYFENCMNEISPDFMYNFASYMPLHTYSLIANLYEKEHDYNRAIYYIKLSKKFGDMGNPFFDEKIKSLSEKALNFCPKWNPRLTDRESKSEKDITNAALYFLEYRKFPKNEKEVAYKKKTMSKRDIEQYAIMCNAYINHQEEMEQYRE